MRDLWVVWLFCAALAGCAGTCSDNDRAPAPAVDAAGSKPLGDRFNRQIHSMVIMDASALPSGDGGH